MIFYSVTSGYRHGCNHVTISDQGHEFVNRVNVVLFLLTGTEYSISTAYYSQTNGLVERYNQTLQRSLSKFCNNKFAMTSKMIGMIF